MKTNGWRHLADGRLGFIAWRVDGPCLQYIALERAEAEAIEEEDIYLDVLLAEGICRSESAPLREAAARAATYAGELPVDVPGFRTFSMPADLARPMNPGERELAAPIKPESTL